MSAKRGRGILFLRPCPQKGQEEGRVKREDFYFDSRDGETRIHAVKWIPKQKPRCILQIIHGMAEYVARYEGLAETLTEEGILVTGEDHFGDG